MNWSIVWYVIVGNLIYELLRFIVGCLIGSGFVALAGWANRTHYTKIRKGKESR